MTGLRKLSAGLLIIITLSIMLPRASHVAQAQTSTIDTSQEYVSGDVQVFPYLQAWYTWISINGTHTVFLALHSNQLPSPVSAFVGQAYNSSTGSKVFIANVLLAMEVYNDTDGNGYLDANYGPGGTTELLYTVVMNASRTFTTIPVQKTITNGVPHYSWGVTYGYVQANLIVPAGTSGAVANITYVTMKYDYSLKGNTTYLKTSYEIGNVTLVPPVSPGITLKGLSLSLLHATLTLSSGQLAVVAGSSPYDSQTNTSSSQVNAATVTVNNALAYEFQFKDNYTLQTNPPQNHPALYTAAPSNSIPSSMFQSTPLIRVQDYVRSTVPSFISLPPTPALNYNASRFFYRIAYPTWGGVGLKHDPTYVAHLGLVPNSPGTQSPFPLIWLSIVPAVLAVFFLAVGVYWIRRRRQPAGQQAQI